MPALSFQREFVDDLLSGSKQHTTRPETDRFKIGDIAQIYIEQRKNIMYKPVRIMTGIGTTAMADRVDNANYHYPANCPIVEYHKDELPSYYAHFLGKVEIADVLHNLLRQHIESRMDMDLFQDILNQEVEDKEELYGYLNKAEE